jgi:hypothetical protein
VFAFLTSSHCKLRPNTEGLQAAVLPPHFDEPDPPGEELGSEPDDDEDEDEGGSDGDGDGDGDGEDDVRCSFVAAASSSPLPTGCGSESGIPRLYSNGYRVMHTYNIRVCL